MQLYAFFSQLLTIVLNDFDKRNTIIQVGLSVNIYHAQWFLSVAYNTKYKCKYKPFCTQLLTLLLFICHINPSKKVLQFKFEGWYLSCYWSMKKETVSLKSLLFLFTMMCHLPWLCNHGMCSTPEYRAKSEVKCCKMHCFQHRSLHFFWRCNVRLSVCLRWNLEKLKISYESKLKMND